MSPTLLLRAHGKSYRMGNSAFKLSSLASRRETRSNERIRRRYRLAFPLKVASSLLPDAIRTSDISRRIAELKLVRKKNFFFSSVFFYFPRRLRRKINSRVITSYYSLSLVFIYIICLYKHNCAHNVTMYSLTICFQMEDEGNHGNDDTRCFILSTLAALQWSRVTCVLCRAAMLVFDRYPLVDGTFFLSPRQHSQTCAEVCFASLKILQMFDKHRFYH